MLAVGWASSRSKNTKYGEENTMSVSWQTAKKGISGLWFKFGVDNQGRKHLLVSESKSGVDSGSHDHYWDNGNGTYGVQLRDKSGTAIINDKKGHIYQKNTTFSVLANEHLEKLFSHF
ncbi:MAG: hypothetical protein VBE63_17585 [Lamprobacter sp.]|uniref:hypothetical protein n=1 Tax=Lamprobacter sp. TaxID=3100796 RepID=UPI002B25DCEF|nr:hypothetical protein [Lamprobacter sp.]MEA3641730.1 hypothetical protein [Lamprobacter sp.]